MAFDSEPVETHSAQTEKPTDGGKTQCCAGLPAASGNNVKIIIKRMTKKCLLLFFIHVKMGSHQNITI